VPDGMKVDVAGNVYTGGGRRSLHHGFEGKKLGRIVHGQPATTNVASAATTGRRSFFTTRSTLFSVNVKNSRRSGAGAEEIGLTRQEVSVISKSGLMILGVATLAAWIAFAVGRAKTPNGIGCGVGHLPAGLERNPSSATQPCA